MTINVNNATVTNLWCYHQEVLRKVFKTLFTWSGGPRSSGVSFFCFVTPLDRGPPLHVNRP